MTPPIDRTRARLATAHLRVSLLAAVLIATLAGCSRDGGAAAPAGPPGAGAPPAMPVTVLAVAQQKVPILIEVVGTLEGVREVEIRARVGGVLQQQFFREGEAVRAGAPLYQIDRAPFEIAIDAARAALAQADARVEQARRELTRMTALVAQQMVSQRAADDAESALKTAEAQREGVKVQVREAQLNLDYTHVNAPIAGLAQRSQRSVGSLVSPGNDSAILTTLVQTNPIRVRFALSEAEATVARSGRGRQVQLIGPDGKPLGSGAKLDFTGSVVDSKLGTVAMRAELPNADGALLPGQYVRARLVAGEREAFVVPQAAVMSGPQGRFVWVVGADNTALAKPVQPGPWQGNDWVIHAGLANGDRVVIDNLIKLRPGAPLAPRAGGAAGSAAGSAAVDAAAGAAPRASAPN